jgi:glutathione peroxidase-family protein
MFLGIVDFKTGEISEKVKLHYKYVEKIRVHNNKIFYIYRPFESIQKRFLYKEKLPYNFSPAAFIVDRDQNKDESND